MVRDWKTRSGWNLAPAGKIETNYELLPDYAKFKRYCQDKTPDYLKTTEEELIKQICKDYNLKPTEVQKMKLSDVIIYTLIKEKEAFESWYAYTKES